MRGGGKGRTSAVHVLLDEVLQLRLAGSSAHLLDDHDLCVHLEVYSQLSGDCSQELSSRVHSIAQIVGRQHGTQRGQVTLPVRYPHRNMRYSMQDGGNTICNRVQGMGYSFSA